MIIMGLMIIATTIIESPIGGKIQTYLERKAGM